MKSRNGTLRKNFTPLSFFPLTQAAGKRETPFSIPRSCQPGPLQADLSSLSIAPLNGRPLGCLVRLVIWCRWERKYFVTHLFYVFAWSCFCLSKEFALLLNDDLSRSLQRCLHVQVLTSPGPQALIKMLSSSSCRASDSSLSWTGLGPAVEQGLGNHTSQKREMGQVPRTAQQMS